MGLVPGLVALSVGSKSAEVGNWQRHLQALGYTDWSGKALVVDEDFGQKTGYCTRQWQLRAGLNPSGTVMDKEREVASKQGFIPFLQAKNFTLVHPKKRNVRVIVIHTMENPEKPSAAEDVAVWFAGRHPTYPAPRASAHYLIDLDSTVQAVRDMDVAWQAEGVNGDGIGIEHSGFAKQVPDEWNDAASRAILWRSARLVARLCSLYQVPVARLSPEDLLAGKHGLCGHVDATVAYKKGTHYDPGPNFPWLHYLALVEASQADPASTKDPT